LLLKKDQLELMQLAMLLQRCHTGEAAAIQELVREYQSAVFRLALSILDDPADAEEATQDTFLAALRALDKYRGDSAFTTWLYRITVNVCLNHLRKRKAKAHILQTLHSLSRLMGVSPTHPEEIVIQGENNAVLWKAVNTLDEKHRMPIILYYYHDLAVAEIAGVMGLREGTVLSRLYTARDRLRAKLNNSAS
jgi:RNA polymerase sigma-70 factor (ECF subfamily)